MSEKMSETSATREKYNRSSKLYDVMEFPLELFKYRKWRENLFSEIRGDRILEVGIGTGKNLKYYRKDYWAAGIDLSEGMLSKAKSVAEKKRIDLVQMDAQNLAFRDDSFDTVLATFVFCSVPDSVRGLREIRRVLKPSGKALFIEHVLPQNPILKWIFNSLAPLISTVSGVHINRNTANNILNAGFVLGEEKSLFLNIFYYFTAKPRQK